MSGGRASGSVCLGGVLENLPSLTKSIGLSGALTDLC